MKINGLIWLEDIVDKLASKHDVTQEEVRELFAKHPVIRFVEKGDRKGENVYAASGQTDEGRYLVAYFVYKQDGRALILSAREQSGKERKRYGKK